LFKNMYSCMFLASGNPFSIFFHPFHSWFSCTLLSYTYFVFRRPLYPTPFPVEQKLRSCETYLALCPFRTIRMMLSTLVSTGIMSLQGRQGDFEYHIQVSTSNCSGCTLYSRVPAVHPRQKLLGGSLEGPLNMVSMDTSTNKYISRPVFF
jgi:hypothetical protein